jgi:iron complex outermembrane recepter protein
MQQLVKQDSLENTPNVRSLVHQAPRRRPTLPLSLDKERDNPAAHHASLRIAAAVTYALLAARLAHAQTPPADSPAGDMGKLEEVLVTATRRTENLQDVPIAITALTGATLQQLNVATFDDYLRYVPSISSANKGPGQSEVYMRGLSTTQFGGQGAGGSGSFPNVAIYLDDQSVQLPGRNLDVYAADLERIEILEGPQGTLYGAGAQAGAVRYITNKPKLNVTEGYASSSYETTAHGDPSSRLQAAINLPLIADTLAIRAVIYDDSRGGYIHNIPGTFTRSSTDASIVSYFGGVVPTGSPSLSNSDIVNHAYNPTVYKGARLSALWQFNDDWRLLLQQSYQSLEADGVFAYAPELGDLNVQQYVPSYSKDRFEDTAWTLEGKLGPLKAVYTGGYLVRNINELTDYTAYSRGGPLASYYQCNGPAVNGTGQNICYSPSAYWQDIERNTHKNHELRLTSADDARVRAVGGLFWEDYKVQDSTNYGTGQEAAGFYPLAPLAGTTQFDPNARAPGVVFFDDITRGYTQKAVFGEVAFDLLPKSLTLSLGTRLYSMDNYERGSKNSAYGCRDINPCTAPPYSENLDLVTFPNGSSGPLRNTISGHKSKINLSWKPIDGTLFYFTYSEGFRPGGFNRGSGVISPSSPLYGKFTIPSSYDTDELKNYEFGWKTEWFNRALQFNGAVYEEKWSNVQLLIYDPALYGNLGFLTNGPNYRVRGLEGEATWRVIEGLTITSSFAWNQSEQINDPQLIGNAGNAVSLFPTAGLGSPLAQCPPFAGNIRARYDLALGSYVAHWQVAAQHTDHSFASVITQGAFEPPNQEQAPYTTYDASLGMAKGAWEAEIYGENLTDTRAQLYVNGFDYVHLVTPNRPRTIGLRVSFRSKGD